MRRWGLLVVVLSLCCISQSWAQSESCLPNELGVNQLNGGTNVTIGNVTPAKVADKNLKRCQLVLINQGASNVYCLPVWQGAPTATRGALIEPGKQLAQNTSGRGDWFCIATSGQTSSVLVLEELPNAP